MNLCHDLAYKNTNQVYEHNQVICEKLVLKEGKTVSVKCFRDGTLIKANLKRKGTKLVIFNETKEVHEIEEGAYLRLAPTKSVSYSVEDNTTSFSTKDRVDFYLRTYGLVGGGTRLFNIGSLLAGQKVKSLFSKGAENLVDLKEEEGITFLVKKVRKDTVELVCVDYGSIYDFYLNNEVARLPPQVPDNYYATAYFAVNAQMLSKKKRAFIKAAQMAYESGMRNYEYLFASVVFQHTEFKYAPLMEYMSQTKHKEELKSILSEYEPTNVYTMRVWNEVVSGNVKRAEYWLDTVEANQLSSGLIQDNFYPFYQDSLDITYHQFALACLCRAHEEADDKILKRRLYVIIEKGVLFSQSIQTSNGELSYYGRGSNNIYHLASAIYSLSYWWSLTKNRASLDSASLALEYLSKSFSKEGWSPSAINDQQKSLVGWNHCEMPYNMQTSYFLLKASQYFKELKKKNFKDLFEVDKNSNFFHFRNKNYELILTAGGDQLSWAAGRHATGVSGIANLLVNNKSKTLSLDYFNNSNPLTDMPRIKVNNEFLPVKKSTLSAKDGVAVLSTNYGSILITKIYTLKEKSIEMRTSITLFKQTNSVEIEGVNNLLLLSKEGLTISKKMRSQKVESNPKGKGTLLTSGHYSYNSVDEEVEIEEVLELTLV